MNPKNLTGETLRRTEQREIEYQEESRTVSFPFSSEYPVQRGYGPEILEHRSDSADLTRLNDGAPFLWNHDPDRVIGVVERAYMDEDQKRGYATVRLSRNDFAQEVLNDIRDGILRGISFGYRIDEMEQRGDDFVATQWSPYELSLAPIPADPTIGVGRKDESETVNRVGQDEPIRVEPSAAKAVQKEPLVIMETTPDLDVVRSKAAADAAKDERARIHEISGMCRKHGLAELGESLIDNGTSVADARGIVLEKIGARPVEKVAPVDLRAAEAEENVDYSIAKGIFAAMRGDWSSKEAGFVRELSQEVELKGGIERTSERSFFVPWAALSEQRSTYVTSTASSSGNLVAEDLLADRFIESLENTDSVMPYVATITGLVGDVKIPRRSGSSSAYWLSNETTAITQSAGTFDQIGMVPRQLAALSKFSRQTLQQATPGIEQLVRGDLNRQMRLAMDLSVLNGSGSSGQPTGILQTSGIGSVVGGTNGGAFSIEKSVDLELELAKDNALSGNLRYVTTPGVVAALKKLRADGSTGAFLYNTDLQAIGRGATPGTLNGYAISSSNQVPSNGTKGTGSNLHTVLYGDFSQCLVGFWGAGVELAISDSDSDDFSKLLQTVRAVTTMDIAIRHPEAFAAMTDVIA